MQPTIYTFLIVCPLVFLAGFVDAVAGGGGLISLPAYLLAGVPVHNAVATNKLSSATGTLISTVRLCKNKFVDWILVLPCIPMALLGSSIGAHLALIASDKLLRYMLIPVLPVVAFYVLRKKNMDEKGGLITYLSDPDLVPPAETLTVYLKTLQEMDVKQMANYLGLDSILNTSDSAKNAIASALMEQFHSCFNYKISSTSVSGYLAEVDAELTTFDSNSILTQYEKELNTYLASADAVIDGSQKRYNKSHELLLDSIRNNQATITATATFHLTNDGASWKLENAGTELGNAIFGTLTASPVPEDSTEDNE